MVSEAADKDEAPKVESKADKSQDSDKDENTKDENTKEENADDIEKEVLTGNWVLPQVDLKECKDPLGEEKETEAWKERSKLYRWDGTTKEWKERGLGESRLLKNSQGKVRFLLRQEKTEKIVANHYVLPKDGACKLSRSNAAKNTCIWSVVDSAGDVPETQKFALRFGTVDGLTAFEKAFDEAGQENLKIHTGGKWNNNQPTTTTIGDSVT